MYIHFHNQIDFLQSLEYEEEDEVWRRNIANPSKRFFEITISFNIDIL